MSQQARASAQPSLPQEAQSYADTYHLGQPQAIYRVRFRDSTIVGVLCLFFGGWFGSVAISGSAVDVSVVIMPVLALLALAGAVYFLIVWPLRYRSWRIYECADGFVFLKGSNAVPCRWDQIAFVWKQSRDLYSRGTYTGSRWKYIVQRTDGVQITMTTLMNHSYKLGRRLEDEVSIRMFPEARAALKAGQTLPFGPFSLSRQGLTTPKEAIPWSEVQDVGFKPGWVTVQRTGQPTGKPVAKKEEVPNLVLFMGLVEVLKLGIR